MEFKKTLGGASNKIAEETVNALNRASVKSSDRNERYEKIYAIERIKWPHNMGSKLRSEIPENLHPLLNECITESQKIARDACQTEELTQEYLIKNNSL